MIPYALFENPLTDDPNDRLARVISLGTVDVEGLVDDIIKRGTTVTRPDLLAALDLYHQVITDRLLAGYRVNTPVVNLGVSIKGTFNGLQDEFDRSRHLLGATATPGKLVRGGVRDQGRPEKREARLPAPNPIEYQDFGSETRNSVLTPGSPGQLTGRRLKFYPADEEQGLFFIAGDGSATRASMVMRNKPADLMFIVPAGLAAGEYKLEVRAAMTEEGAVRSGQLSHTLTVT